MNNGTRINWLDLLIKLILVVIFVFLLLWLIPKNNVEGINDAVYANNINTMKDAAKSYYTKDRLPSNVGESTKMTLKQMLDKKMLVELGAMRQLKNKWKYIEKVTYVKSKGNVWSKQ